MRTSDDLKKQILEKHKKLNPECIDCVDCGYNDRYYDRQGNIINHHEWQLLRPNDKYFRIALDSFEEMSVRTLWKGDDYLGNIRIEMTLFYGNNLPRMLYARASDENQAMMIHNKVVFLADQKILYKCLQEVFEDAV